MDTHLYLSPSSNPSDSIHHRHNSLLYNLHVHCMPVCAHVCTSMWIEEMSFFYHWTYLCIMSFVCTCTFLLTFPSSRIAISFPAAASSFRFSSTCIHVMEMLITTARKLPHRLLCIIHGVEPTIAATPAYVSSGSSLGNKLTYT